MDIPFEGKSNTNAIQRWIHLKFLDVLILDHSVFEAVRAGVISYSQ
uniref:Uncharacterized protein n=1 Tax=Anguilla anguilla TaxID=7936 RepID=A0A0E9XN59_ANGAN